MILHPKRLLYILLFSGTMIAASGQELFLPLAANPALKGESPVTLQKSISATLLELPVVDDFSYPSHLPSSQLWTDHNAFINNGFAVNPPTIGVATLDALDYKGAVYINATLSPKTFSADTLSSQPINLAYPASDSIYFSFYYQPEGNGWEPQPFDSLCVDFFYAGSDTSYWKKVWSAPGENVTPFKAAMIPVTDTSWLKEGFRFRFRNLASLPSSSHYADERGNVDHWNIDYVKLDRNRNYQDTVQNDVAFYLPTPSMLLKYESVPWDHFENAYSTLYKPFITLSYKNNHNIPHNISRYLSISDQYWNEIFEPSTITAQDIAPYSVTTYEMDAIYPFEFQRSDSASFLIKSWIRTDEFDRKENDTIYRHQVFKDYFAYDDGSAEAGYGLYGLGTKNGLIAVKHSSFIEDSIAGVDIYFTQLYNSINLDYYYKFMVWGDNDGEPGEILYEDRERRVVYGDSINRFVRIFFDSTVTVDGTFYIGLLQFNQYLLNIGLDVNKVVANTMFYNLGSSWEKSAAPGTIMLRPFVKRPYQLNSTQEHPALDYLVYPNPVDDYLHIQLEEFTYGSQTELSIFDISGRKVLSKYNIEESIYLGDLPEGMYFLKLSAPGKKYKARKILIKR